MSRGRSARLTRIEVRQEELSVRLDESLSRVDDAVVSLERSLGQRLAGLEVKLCVVQSDIAALPKGHSDDRLAALQGAIVQMSDRMTRLEELSEARDANIQALLLRLLQGAGLEARDGTVSGK